MIFVRDRVKQGTTTNGAGTISLTSSFGGYQNFSVLGNNSKTFYAIEESTNWEVGIGTYSGTTLTRDTVLDSASGAGTPIHLSGSAFVFVTYPASGSVFSTGSIALATGIKLGSSGIVFSDGTAQTTAGATVANLASTGNTLSANLVSTGNSLDVRISTIETTGVATAANLLSTGATNAAAIVADRARLTTIESTGVATAANLLATGATNASGIVADRARLTTIESTGVATAANLASTGDTLSANLVSTGNSLGVRISTIETTGVATAANLAIVSGLAVDHTTYVAGTGLTLIGNEFNTSGTGHFDQITFTDNNIQIGDVNYYGANTGNTKTIEIGWNAGGGNDNNTDTIFIGRNSAGGGGSGNDESVFIGTQAGQVAIDSDYSVFLGYDAGALTKETKYSNIIGYQAGKQVAISYKQGPRYSNVVGYQAGYDATGFYNQYIGYGAGKGVSGNYNIDIQTYRNGVSILGDNSNKLNIESTVVGDTDSKKLAIGNVGTGNLDPDATLEIIPKATSDVGLIVQRAGGSADLTVWQTGTLPVASVNSTGAISGAHYEFGDGTIQTTALVAGSFTSASGAKIDSNTTNLATTGNFLVSEVAIVSGLAGGGISATSGARIDLNTTNLASTGNTLSANLVSTGNSLGVRISTIETTGVATAANLLATGATNAAAIASVTPFSATSGARIDLNSTRISTIESSGSVTGLGSAPSANIKKLTLWDATDGLTFDSNLTYDTSVDKLTLGVSGIGFADASNQNTAFENWSVVVNSPDKEYYNIISASSNTIGSGAIVEFTGAGGIFTTGQLAASRHKVTISGVAGSTSQVGVLQLQDSVDTSTTKAVTPNAVRVVSGDLQSQIGGGGSFPVASGAKVDLNTTNLATTGNFLVSEVAIVSGLAGGGISVASGARIDLNTTNLASTGNTLSANLVSTGNSLGVRISTIETTGVATAANLASTGSTLYVDSVTTGNVLNTRISTIESTGVATAANLLATGATNASGIVVDRARLTTIESTGVATAANLLATGATNAAAIAAVTPFSSASGARVDLNTTNLVSTGVIIIANTAKATTNAANISTNTSNILATGATNASGIVVDRARLTTIESTGVATAANLLATGATNAAAIAAVTPFSSASGAKIDLNTTNLASTGSTLYSNSVTTGNVLNTRISTIESTGVATAANLIATGVSFQDSSINVYLQTGDFSNIRFGENIQDTISIGSSASTSGALSTHIGYRAGMQQTNSENNILIGQQAGRYLTDSSYNVAVGFKSAMYNEKDLFGVSIGYQAGQGKASDVSPGSTGSIKIGALAGHQNTGNWNIFLGPYAGAYSNGTGNIEITAADGVNTSLLSDTASSAKINIGRTIVGDRASNRIAIGHVGVSDLSPDATLEIIPKANDKGLIVHRTGAYVLNALTVWKTGTLPVARVTETGAMSGQHFEFGDATIQTTSYESPLIATGVRMQDGDHDINVAIATASGIVTPLISGNSTANTYLDLSLGSNFNYVLTTNTRFLTQNVTKGQKFTLRTEQDSGGTNTVTWAMGAQIKWAEGGTAPTGTYYGGKGDYYGFVAVETGLFDGFVIGSNIQ